MKKSAQFYAQTPEEHKAILSLLYSYGYSKYNYTLEACQEDLKEFPYIIIFGNQHIGANFTWRSNIGVTFSVKDDSIGKIIEFLTEKPSVLVADFGDYTAQVFADELFIGGKGVTVPFDRVKEIYDIIASKPKTFTQLHITVKNDQERRFLIHALNSFGYINTYSKNVDDWCSNWQKDNYGSVVVYSNKTVGANTSYSGYSYDTEYVFSRDMDELYHLLTGQNKKIEVADIAGYDVGIRDGFVRVGCQLISYDKIKEAYEAMVKLQG